MLLQYNARDMEAEAELDGTGQSRREAVRFALKSLRWDTHPSLRRSGRGTLSSGLKTEGLAMLL